MLYWMVTWLGCGPERAKRPWTSQSRRFGRSHGLFPHLGLQGAFASTLYLLCALNCLPLLTKICIVHELCRTLLENFEIRIFAFSYGIVHEQYKIIYKMHYFNKHAECSRHVNSNSTINTISLTSVIQPNCVAYPTINIHHL